MSNATNADNANNNNQLAKNGLNVSPPFLLSLMVNTIKKYPKIKLNVCVPNGNMDDNLTSFIILYLLILSENFVVSFCFPSKISNGFLTNERLPTPIVMKEDNNIPINIKNPENSFPKNEDITK